jgi:hypothetical protein
MADAYEIMPVNSGSMWAVIIPAVLLLGFLVFVFGSSFLGARQSRFIVSSEGLRISGDVYGRLIPARELRVEEARVVDLSSEAQLRPARRTFGTGMPGYSAGWFTLQNGEKALVYLTDRRRAVYVPTSAGYSVLLSPRDPDQFVRSLKTIAP